MPNVYRSSDVWLLKDGFPVLFGTGGDAKLVWETADADAHYLNLVVGPSRNFIISEDASIDWTHTTSTNPRLWIQSANSASVADYIAFYHNQTDGYADVGAGYLRLKSVNGIVIMQGAADRLVISGDGTVTTIIPPSGDYLRIGDATTTSHSLASNDDLLVTGSTEFDNTCYFDSTSIFAGTSKYNDNVSLIFGTDSDVQLKYNTAQTPDTLTIGVGAESNNIILCELADVAYDFAHALQTNPTLFIQSANQSATQWVSFTHDQTNPVFKAGAGNFKFHYSDGLGAFWKEYHIGPTKADPGGSGATLTISNSTLYYLMDAITEYLYFSVDVDSDWDGTNDIIVEVYVALNSDETANDTINASLRADYYGEHDDMDAPKTQTRSVDHDIVNDNTAGEVHKLTFVIDEDLASHNVDPDDMIFLRFWCDALGGAGEVAGVRFLFAKVKYRTKDPSPYYPGSMPAEG